MEAQDPRKYSINDFREWHTRGELVLNPRFQRRSVWSPKAKSFLIDTIIRKLPVPMIYIRQQIDLPAKKTIREVVDGQQRLRAILDYLNGAFAISRSQNADFGGRRFSDLPPAAQTDFLKYPFAVDVLEGASDADVLTVFARLNSYTVMLNEQEKLNAAFYGLFKQTAYALAHKHLTFWRNNKILSDRDILRMEDAKLTSELLVAMLHGLQDGSKVLRSYYKKYDEEFSEADRVTRRFNSMIDEISTMFGTGLSATPYAERIPLFYSLFCALYDAEHGLPNSQYGPEAIHRKKYGAVATALINLAENIDSDDPPNRFASFIAASKQETNTIKMRSLRHRHLWNAIRSAL
jgi:hypothetical protein